MKAILFLLVCLNFIYCSSQPTDQTKYFPKKVDISTDTMNKQNMWVFILAGQSNMAGRGFVEPEDTIPDRRLLTIDKNEQLIIAKEPLHFYEPNLTGLDCG